MSKRETQGNAMGWVRTWVLATVALVVLAAGCASTGSTGERTSRDVLTREQLAPLDNLTAFDAVRRLRPLWLRTERGQDSFDAQGSRGLRVYVNHVHVGGVDTLREYDVRNIDEIRFLDKRQATTRFGMNNAEGAILITERT